MWMFVLIMSRCEHVLVRNRKEILPFLAIVTVHVEVRSNIFNVNSRARN